MIQQQIQQVFVERTLLVKQENIARRNYKVANWLKLLSLHQQNHDQAAVNDVIRNEIHQNFIMQEGFWLHEANKRFSKETVTREDVEILMLGIEDGHYLQLSALVAEQVVAMYRAKRLSETFALSVLQKIIALFSYGADVGIFFRLLRSIYSTNGSQAKLRSAFQRQLRLAHDNFDLVWDQYKLWQPQPSLVDKNLELYSEAKIKWQKQAELFDENICSESNVRLSLINLESVNESKIDEERYMYWIQKLQGESDKLWFLRRMALNYRQLLIPYLIKLQNFYKSDEETLLKKYKVAIRLGDHSRQIQLKYLRFLARRIARHLLNESLPQNYNQTWANNVTFFREEVSSLISKERVGVSQQESELIFRQYYNLWISVQQKIVRDKESVCQLYENLLKATSDLTIYEDYSESLIALGGVKQAKNVLKRYTHHANLNERSADIYLRFIEVFGTVEDQMNFYRETHTPKESKMVQSSEIEKQQKSSLSKEKKQNTGSSSKGIKPDQEQEHQSIIQSNLQEQNALKRQRPEVKDQLEDKIYDTMRKRLHVDSDHTVYLKGIPTNWTESDIIKTLSCPQDVVRVSLVVKDHHQKDYCYIQYKDKQSAQKEVQNNKNEYKLYMSKPPAEYDQSSTLFVCALPQSANEAKIRSIFGLHKDKIVDIRLKVDKDKNYAYVEFASVEEKEAAFEETKKQSLIIDGKKIIVQHCDSSRAKTKKFVPVVFLKNLAFKAQQKDIRQFFEGKTISKLSIPFSQDKHRHQGFAYVQFQKFKDYQDALDMRKGTLHGREFLILRSDRQITGHHQKIDYPQQHSAKSKVASEKSENQRVMNAKKSTKQSQKNQSEVKDNSYFSKLFK